MPIYEYLCDDCGTQFEKLTRMGSTASEIDCPSCGHDHVTPQISTFSARANGVAKDAPPSCPSGMCATPGFCGRN